MLAGRLPAAAHCPGGLIQEGAELQDCSKHAKACSYTLRICRRGSQPFQLKCKGTGMQESLFSIPVATHTPEPLPPSTGRWCSARGPLLAAHPAAQCTVPAVLTEERQFQLFSCMLSSTLSLRNPGKGFPPFPISLCCSSALEHSREHCWEMGWSLQPAGDASSSTEGFPSQEGNPC